MRGEQYFGSYKNNNHDRPARPTRLVRPAIDQKDFLSESGTFLFGKHKGELAENVARDDPGYVQWIVRECEDCSDEDREVLSSLLTYRERI